MENKLLAIFYDIFRLKPGTPVEYWTMETVECWDSLRHMELIGLIEQQYAIELSFDEIVIMQSFSVIQKILIERDRVSS